MASGKRLVLVAGEASGDDLAAELAVSLNGLAPAVELAGMAGPAMRSAGVTPWLRTGELEVMGLSEVLVHLPRIARLRSSMYRQTLDWPAECFIGVDAPDFNLGLARRLRKRGLFTVQYVCPSVWAWRRWRIARIARSLNLLLTLFPFEPALFRHTGLDARFVGHPLADRLPFEPDRERARTALGLSGGQTVIGLLPGSRPGEIRRHAGLVAETAARLHRAVPDARLLVLLADSAHEALFTSVAGAAGCATLDFRCAQTRTGIIASDVVLAASGTVTLEAFLLKTPMVVFYRLAPATYRVIRGLRLVHSRYIALPNILLSRHVVPERIQHAAAPDRLAADVLNWLETPAAVSEYAERAGEVHAKLARNAGRQAATAILERLDER